MADWDNHPKGFNRTDLKFKFPKMPAPAAGIFDNPVTCVRINTEWVSIVLGRLQVLSSPYAYIGNETEQHRASQQIEKLLEAMANLEDCIECPDPEPCPECDPPSLRQNGNCIEWLNPVTLAWECQLTISVPPGGCGDCDCDDCEDEECDDCEGW